MLLLPFPAAYPSLVLAHLGLLRKPGRFHKKDSMKLTSHQMATLHDFALMFQDHLDFQISGALAFAMPLLSSRK